MTTTTIVSADGEHAALHDFGGTGPNLLLCHGNGLNAGMWRATLPLLTARFRCYGLDLRGHGANRRTQADYSVDRKRMAEDVIAAIEAIGPDSIRYVAHSLGGAAGIFAGIRRPELFASMWLFEPVVVPITMERTGGPTFLIEASRRRRMEFDSVDAAIENFLTKPPFNTCDPEAVRGYVELGTYPVDGGVRLSCEGEDEARVFESGEAIDFDRLAAITCPTIIARGENTGDEHAIPAAVAVPVAEAIPHATLRDFVGLTHFGPMEDPTVIATAIIEHFTA